MYCCVAAATVVPWRKTKRESYAIKSFNGYWHARALLLLTGGLWVVSQQQFTPAPLQARHCPRPASVISLASSLTIHWLPAACPGPALGFTMDPRFGNPAAAPQCHRLDPARLAVPSVLDIVPGLVTAPVLAFVSDVVPGNSQVYWSLTTWHNIRFQQQSCSDIACMLLLHTCKKLEASLCKAVVQIYGRICLSSPTIMHNSSRSRATMQTFCTQHACEPRGMHHLMPAVVDPPSSV